MSVKYAETDLTELIAVVKSYRALIQKYPAEQIELELRLGVLQGDTFVPGVTIDAFESLHQDMEECSTLEISNRAVMWAEHIDYHYIAKKGKKIRTRVHFDSSEMKIHTGHTEKSVVETLLINTSDGHDTIARLSLSRELNVDVPDGAMFPCHVRIKQRRSFIDMRDESTVWSYDLSRVWSANSRSAVEYRQNKFPPNYEVECELVDSACTYLNSKSDAYIAQSILLKMNALIGIDKKTRCLFQRHLYFELPKPDSELDTRNSRRRPRATVIGKTKSKKTKG